MAQTKLITDLVSLVTPSDNDVLVIVDNTTSPSQSVTKKISYSNLKEALEDAIGTFISGSTSINAVYDDASNTFTISVVNDTSVQKVTVSSGGTNVGSRKEINFIPGAEITVSGADNSGSNRIDFTINTTAVSSGANVSVSGTSYGVFSGVTTLGNNTKALQFRPIKAGSSKAVVAFSDGGSSISVDVDPSQIAITSLNSSSPLDIPRGGTGSSTASGALTNLGAAKAGANSDITSLSGLTTALSIGQGGTAATTASGALQNLGGLNRVVHAGTIGESLVVTGSTLVGGAYRSELRGIKANSNKVAVSTSGNDVAVDVNSDAVLAGATVNVPFNGVRLTNIGAPLNNSDAATKAYVDSFAKGLIAKEAVFVATTTGLSSTYSASGLTLTISGTGVPSIDGVNITATGTRVLVKNQSAGSENGIYYLATAAASGVSAQFARAEDYNADIEIQEGTFCYVISGVVNGGQQFIQTTKDPALDSDSLVYVQFGGSTIADDSITNAKLANMNALSFKGAVVSGDPIDLTADQAIAIINSGGTTAINAARVNIPLGNYQEFTSNGTWTKPSGMTTVYVELVGGGGGGGSGARYATSSNRGGGGGGAGGAFVSKFFAATGLSSTVSVSVGAGGSGGAAVTTDTTNGNAGSAGGNSQFGSFLTTQTAGAGAGGSTSGGSAGTISARVNTTYATDGTGGGISGTITAALSPVFGGAGGGGGNGTLGVSPPPVSPPGFPAPPPPPPPGPTTGGTGGFSRLLSSTFSGATAGVSATASEGGGGGGGSYVTSVSGMPGGNGAFPGGGGAGGSASDNGFNSGAGGNGGNGYVRVWAW